MPGGREASGAAEAPNARAGAAPLETCPSATAWQLIIEHDGRPGAENMAVDAALLDAARAGTASLRLYRWNPPTLSFGRNEAALQRYDRDAIRRLGLATVRRPTGGRAVWHDREVTYAVAAPAHLFGTLREAYISIHRLLATALTALGLDVTLAPERRGAVPDLGHGACFAAPVGGEVVVRGRKLVGSAQVREGLAFLQHGSMLLAGAQDVVRRVTRGRAAPDRATSLAEMLGRHVSFAEVADLVAAAARAEWPGSWRAAPLEPPSELAARFADPAWIWRR
jgi:lipoate-protein ligase A